MSTSNIDILIEAKDNASNAIRNTAKEVANLEGKASSFSSGGGASMLGAFKGIAGVLAVATAAFSVVKSAMNFEQTSVAFQTMLGDAGQAKALLAQLSAFAAATPFEFPEIADAGKKLLAFGVSAAEIEPSLRRIGDIASGIGAPIGEIAELYGKAKVQGRLFAEDINQFQGRGIPILGELAKVLGVSEAQVKSMVAKGKVGFPELQTAFANLTGEGGKFSGMMARQSTTIAGLFSTASDTVMQLGRDILGISQTGEVRAGSLFEKLREGIAKFIEIVQTMTPYILGFFNGVGVIIGGFASGIKSVAGGIVASFKWVGDNIDSIIRVMVAGAIGVATGALLLNLKQIIVTTIAYTKLGATMLWNNGVIVAKTLYIGALTNAKIAWNAVTSISIKSMLNLGKSIFSTIGRVALMAAGFLAVAAVVALVVSAVYNNWDNLKKKLAPVFAYIAEIGQKVPDLIASGWNSLVDIVADSVKLILKSTKTVGEWLTKMGVTIIDPTTIDAAVTQVEKFAKGLKFSGEDVKTALKNIKDGTIGAFTAITSSFDALSLKPPKIPPPGGGGGEDKLKKNLDDLKKKLEEVANKVEAQYSAISGKADTSKKKVEELTKQYGELGKKLAEIGTQGAKDLAKIDEQLAKNSKSIEGSKGEGEMDIAKRAIAIQNELKGLQSDSGGLSDAELASKKKKLEEELKLAQVYVTSGQIKAAQAELDKSETQNIIEKTIKKMSEGEAERLEIIKTRDEKVLAIVAEKIEIQKQMDDKLIAIKKEKMIYGSLVAERMNLDAQYFATFGQQIEMQISKTKDAITLMDQLNAKSGGGSAGIAGARANGGPVAGGSTYLVGERGPELFTPRSGGNITPNNALGGVSVTIGNITVGQGQDPRSAGRIIADEIARQMQLGKKGIYA